MPIVVQVPNVGNVEFPDEATAQAYFDKQKEPLANKLGKGFLSAASGVTQSMPQTGIAEVIAKMITGKPSALETTGALNPTAETGGKIAGEIAQYMAGGAAAKAIPGLAGKALLPSMARGALSNVAVQQGQGLNLDPKKIGLDALLGSGGELASAGINLVGKGVKGAGSRIINAALQLTKKDIKAGKNLGEEIINRFWKPRTLGGWGKTAESELTKNEGIIQSLLAQHEGQTISPQKAVDYIGDLIANPKYQAAGEGSTKGAIQNVLDDFLNSLRGGGEGTAVRNVTLPEANAMKRGLYKAAGERSYLPDVAVNAKKAAQKTLARGLKESIEAIEPAVTPVNQELAFWGKLANAAEDAAANQGKKGVGLSLMDLAIGGGPFAGTFAAGGDITPELILPLIAKKILWDTKGGQVAAGMGLGKIGKAIQALRQGGRSLGPTISELKNE